MAEATPQPSNHIFEKGKVIIKQGRSGTSAFIIVKGRVEVSIKDEKGEKKVLAILEEQDIFGEMALINDKPRTATCTALDEVECTVLSREMFKKLPPNNPGVQAVRRIMEKRLKKTRVIS